MSGRSETTVFHDDAVVIAGAGLVTALGLNRQTTWNAILQGETGIRPLTMIESPLNPNPGGGEAPPLDSLPGDETQTPREARYLRKVLVDALRDAGLETNPAYPPQRCGIILGTTLHGMRNGGAFLRTGDFTHLGRFLASATLRSALADLAPRFAGLTTTTCSACSSGLAAIALAAAMLRTGELDLVLAGGYDPISEYSYAGFNSMRLVTSGEIRPFSARRDGMKVAEGYGVVALERESNARQRGATVLGRILGIGESCDSFHLSKPHPEGAGAAAAMRAALKADRTVENAAACSVDLIVAHATATPDNDAAEYAALQQVFGPRLAKVPVVALKRFLGHSLGAAGAVELILALSALDQGIIPGSPHTLPDDPAFPGLQLATGHPQPAPLHRVLCTSLGFGGANVSILLGAGDRATPSADSLTASREPAACRRDIAGTSGTVASAPQIASSRHANPGFSEKQPDDILITGLGIVLPWGIGREAARVWFDPPTPENVNHVAQPEWRVSDDALDSLLAARRVRRMSRYAKLTLAAATLACRDAGLAETNPLDDSGGTILATTHGAAEFCHDYYRQLIREGVGAANPVLFSEGVPNVAAAHLSTALGIRGFCQTLIGTRTAGLDALRLAVARIRLGIWSKALIVAAEECIPLIKDAYRHFALHRAEHDAAESEGGRNGFAIAEGAVALVLESSTSVAQRGTRPHASARGAVSATWASLSARDAVFATARVLQQLMPFPDLRSEPRASACAAKAQPNASRQSSHRHTKSGTAPIVDRAHCIFASACEPRLARIEAAAARLATRRLRPQQPPVFIPRPSESIECFSVGPLASLAGWVSSVRDHAPKTPNAMPATALLLASDYAGFTTGVAIEAFPWSDQQSGVASRGLQPARTSN